MNMTFARRGHGMAAGVILLVLSLAPAATAADTPDPNTVVRSPSDASGRTLSVYVKNGGATAATSVQITLGPDGDDDTIDAISPASQCTALVPAGDHHGVTCTFGTTVLPAGATKRIAFRTSERYPNLGGGSLVINAGAPITLPGPEDVKPVARYSITRPKTNQEVHFNAGASHDDDGTIVKYAWDFGDGTKGTGKRVTHTYKRGGSFVAKLAVTDNNGLKGHFKNNIFVHAPAPAATFSDPDHVVLRSTAAVSSALSGDSGLLGLLALSGKGKAFGAPYLALSASDAGLASALRRAATIKTDKKYKTVPVPHARYIGRFDPGHGVSRRLAKAVKLLAGEDAKINAYVNVLAVNINRAETAKAASKSVYQERQFHAAARAAKKAATLLKGRRALRLEVVGALRASGHSTKVSAATVERLAKRVAAKGLPKSATKLLSALDVTKSSARALTSAIGHAKAKQIDVAAALGGGKVTKAERRAAKTLKAFAREAGK